MAKLAVDAYIKSAIELENPTKWPSCFNQIKRAFRLAKTIKYKVEKIENSIMIFLVDRNFEGQALSLFGSIAKEGWLDLFPIRFVTFEEVQLSIRSSDRLVWRFAQENQMILLTANRAMKGKIL